MKPFCGYNGPSGEAVGESGERVTRVVTCDFPHYLAVVSRVRQEVHVIGPEGGTVSSAHIPQVQALFPPQALTKRIRVGLQAHGAAGELCRRVLPRHAAVSPVLTVEPRRRKFHRSITLTVPLPVPHQGAVHDKASTATLRLLCSIMGGQARAVWEDVTGSTPLTLTEDCASFTTTVSARFWLMNCQNVSDATKLATELYREMLLVPFEVRIVVLGKRLDALEGRLLVLYITDRYAYDTLLKQEHYTEIAHSTAVRFLDGKEVFLEFSGNLVPVTKSGSQPMFTFEAFKDNRVEFTVRVKHHEESPAGRVYFMNEPKVAKGEQSQTPACVLDVELPERIAPRAAKSQIDYLNLDQSGFDALKDELSFHWGDHNNSLGPASLPGQGHQVNGHDKIITNGNVKYPTSDGEDKDTKPQVNGGSLHVDSNKTKATFDSDEDKTPMNTLEKGKKKPEGGSFFGGIADKVKNVFNYSDDKDEDVKESSPKPEPPQPQPKPRETKEKEKTPPKPAPRLITEDLLEKVDDMFKDIKHKPHIKDEDELDSHIYSTKLIVDEDNDQPPGLHDITEEVYQQYENMQPVETPGCCKTSDPFQFYTGCCEGKYKKGQKHRHDETSNLVDRVEQINFTAHEKLDDLSDKVQNNINDGLNKIGEERDAIKQQTIEASEDLIEKTDALKKRLKDKGDEWKSSIDEKAKESENALNDQLNKLNEDVKDKKQTIQSSIEAEIENAKSSTKDTLSQLAETTNLAKSKLEDKVHEVDFAARERAEQLRLASQDKIEDLETNIRNAANEKSKDLSDTMNNVQENIKNNVQDLKNDLNTNVNNAKDKTKDKMNDVNDAMNNAKDKVQKAAADTKTKAGEKKDQIETEVKKKKKEGKNFFTGLVHNIFGEKDKIENEIKEKASETQEYTEQLVKQASDKKDEINEKIAEGRESAERLAKEQKDKAKEKVTEAKETADELIQKASSKKDNIEQNLKKKKVEISENIDYVVEATQDKKAEVEQALRNKKDEAEKVLVDKTGEIKAAFDDKRQEMENTVEDKLDSLRHTKDEVQSEAKSQLERIWQEAVQTTEEIKKSGETLANATANKKSDLQNNVSNKIEQLKESGKEEIVSVQNAASDKYNDLQETSKQTLENLQESTLSTFDKVESAAKDKANAAKESWEEVQSSARDTYADMRDDVTSLENSAQDTLHSFQSSAGNTFDSLDESVKEYVSGASNTLQNVENNSKELFGDAKNTFEGFQISADNKLEDVKASAKDSLEDAGARLGETKDAVKEDLKGAEESVMNTVSSGADKLASGFEAVGNFALGAFDQGVKKDSSTKLLESEKAQSSPHKKSSGTVGKWRWIGMDYWITSVSSHNARCMPALILCASALLYWHNIN
ncbi:Ankyrin-3 [Papilio xuthus]|uniref:Ankyrin-3 n=1 Tax=Papilio xuthus TaxID=66420 RepID=A0A194Q6M4_PAPXU|nr:Ankyrin-3 [Papilio xuthus]